MIDLAKVVEELGARLRARLKEIVNGFTGEGSEGGDLYINLGVTDAAIHRGVLAYHLEFSRGEDIDDAAVLFALFHAFGETAAMRRVKVALSDPRAKGREVEVIDALTEGAEIEDALRAGKVGDRHERPGGSVLPFARPKR